MYPFLFLNVNIRYFREKLRNMGKLEKKDFLCPKCKGHLNAGGYLIFNTKNQKNQKGLILLDPGVGSYDYKHHENYNFQKGENIEFTCPICQYDLKSKKNPKFASVIMIDHQNMEYEVLFSRIAGEKSTYVFAKDNIEAFGEHAEDFEDLFEY